MKAGMQLSGRPRGIRIHIAADTRTYSTFFYSFQTNSMPIELPVQEEEAGEFLVWGLKWQRCENGAISIY